MCPALNILRSEPREMDPILQLDIHKNGVLHTHRASHKFWTWMDGGACPRICALSVQSSAPATRSAVATSCRTSVGWVPARTILAPGARDAGKYDSDSSSDKRRRRRGGGAQLALQTFTRRCLSHIATILLSTALTLSSAQLTARNLFALVLGPLSSIYACFVEWHALEYTSGSPLRRERCDCLACSWVPLVVGWAQCRCSIIGHGRTHDSFIFVYECIGMGRTADVCL
ncbi:hypothetical protein EDB87DRAFT_509382 [Lactarius vividus]|nr:hypothetical protein EDB87DRAFT_509382 [Lactarius vividus]